MIKEFEHIQSSHCETGAIVSLLNYYGFHISEPMAFGIGSGLFFAHIPFLKPNSIPLTAFRVLPDQIRKRLSKKLGIKIIKKKFGDPTSAMDYIDNLLEHNHPVGLVTNIFYLPYFPEKFRFHYNHHNTLVYAKEGNNYLVSDPIMENRTYISYDDLKRARYSQGGITLKGNMFYIDELPENLADLKIPVIEGIKTTSKRMMNNISPFTGVKGMRFLAKRITKWQSKFEDKKLKLYMGNIIRMLEEVGTGGAGFRYMYAAFLQEAALLLKKDWLLQLSEEMTEAGDCWREFSYYSATFCKTDKSANELIEASAQAIIDCAKMEAAIFKKLSKIS